MCAESLGQLQRKERVPARGLVNTQQRLAREWAPDPVAQEAMERADTERPDQQPLDSLRLECALEGRGLPCFDDPPGQQQSHALAGHTSQREHKRARRGRVEPLDVVDGEHDRRLCGERLQGCPNRHGERARVDRLFESIVHEQRHFERLPSRCRQGGQNLLEHALEEVTEHDVRERALGLGRARREDAETLLVRFFDRRTPKRGLPDPRLALEHERPRSSASSCRKAPREPSSSSLPTISKAIGLPAMVTEVARKLTRPRAFAGTRADARTGGSPVDAACPRGARAPLGTRTDRARRDSLVAFRGAQARTHSRDQARRDWSGTYLRPAR